jgi:AraC-like DNA-binding protein
MPASSRLLRVSTEMFPEKERFSTFREEFVRQVMAMDVIDRSGGRPRADLTFMPLGPVAVGALASTPMEFVRQKHHLKDGGDDFILEVIGTGPVLFEHAGEARTYESGAACFFDQARPQRGFGLRVGSGVRNVTVHAAALKTLVSDPEDLAGCPVQPGPALHLLDGYLRSLTILEEPPSLELAQVIGGHLLDLVAAVLGPSRDAAEAVAKRGIRAARLRAILAEIARRFTDPGFNLDAVVRTSGLSRRYVQELLEETGKSFTDHLLNRRLERAFVLLTDHRSLHLSVIEIVGAAGFGDVSHFNRVFRRRYGDTPSGVRAAAAGRQ